ncbi:TetR family transcriptional regulator C-terminal domain-containing protein [bacterium]|nr:TetR family transcriptional regulator C-terminal domain-containing protein [bacterium]
MFEHIANTTDIATATASEIAKATTDFAKATTALLGVSPTQKQDRRSRRTRGRLVNALMSLLRDKPLKSITVTELTELADVNRATFYSHYRDVFDMINQIKSDSCEVVRSIVRAHLAEISSGNYRPLLADIVDYIDKNRESISIVLGPNGDSSFFYDIVEVIRQTCMEAVDIAAAHEREEIKDHQQLFVYHFFFLAGGVMGILKSWLESDEPEDATTITDVINTYVKSLPISLLHTNVQIVEKAEGMAHTAVAV